VSELPLQTHYECGAIKNQPYRKKLMLIFISAYKQKVNNKRNFETNSLLLSMTARDWSYTPNNHESTVSGLP
jgi:hypothetical protein